MVSLDLSYNTLLIPTPTRAEPSEPICQNSNRRHSLEFMYSFNLMSCIDCLVMFEHKLQSTSPKIQRSTTIKPITKSEWWIVISSELIQEYSSHFMLAPPNAQLPLPPVLSNIIDWCCAVEHEGHHVYRTLQILFMCTNNKWTETRTENRFFFSLVR